MKNTQRIVKDYRDFLNESSSGRRGEGANEFDRYNLDISLVTKNSNGSIDYDGDVDLHAQELNQIPFNFNKVSGDFKIYNNQLINLQGCPKYVGGYFDCSYNQVTSLEGAPESVGEHFFCAGNALTVLQYIPEKIKGNFSCEDNRLKSLNGCPRVVEGDFDCSVNQLTSLQESPKYVGGNFLCAVNNLLTLKHNKVGGFFGSYWKTLPYRFINSVRYLSGLPPEEQREILDDLKNWDPEAHKKVMYKLSII